MTDEEFDKHLMSILARELGLGGLPAVSDFTAPGAADYTAERHQWLTAITIDDIERELKTKSPQ